MKKLTFAKKLGSLTMVLAVALAITVTALPAYAAGSGTATVHYDPAKDHGLGTEFSLYKVGHFERYTADNVPEGAEVGDSYLALDEGVPDVGGKVDLTIKRDDYEDTDEGTQAWTDAWQASAAALAGEIKNTGITPVTANADADGDAVFTGLEDGLYLVTGPREEIMDKTTGQNTYYTPAASFIMVLNGRASLTVKYEIETVSEYVLTKIWDIPTKYQALKPESVDVKLRRRDSSVEGSDFEDVETVTLNDSNKWTYEWKSDPKFEWEWEEVMPDSAKIHFSTKSDSKLDENDNKKYVKITNTYEKRQLKLTKILDQFLENGENGATFAFEIKGYITTEDNQEKLVWTGSAGINFKGGTGSLDTLVDNIPVNLTRLEVTEVYAGNYKVKGEKTKNATFNVEQSRYEVSFENEFNDDITIKGGIVNKYTNEEGKIVLNDKDYGKTPSGAQEQ